MTDEAYELKQSFDRDGFVVIRGFVEGRQLEQLRLAIDSYIMRIPALPRADVMYEDRERPDTLKQLAHMRKNDDYFAALIESTKWTGIAEVLLGDSVVPQELEWFNKAPGANVATPPHQDGYYYMLEPNEAVTMWLALDPVDEGNGCMRYIPGSHRRGLRLHGRTEVLGFSQGITDYGAEDRAAEVPIIANPGDLLVHHAGTIHRADRNESQRHRRSLGFIYYGARAQQDTRKLAEYQQKLNQELHLAQKV